ncbi:hypothetical protein BGZ76_010707 [Entomortierella beljakovae]|nr:hypothetical protein BGZ76_010707 [Entomortierella beljakovae]
MNTQLNDSNKGNDSRDMIESNSNELTQEPANTLPPINNTDNAKSLEAKLKFNLLMIHTLVGNRVDTENIDSVLHQRMEALKLIRTEESDKKSHQQGSDQHDSALGSDSADRSQSGENDNSTNLIDNINDPTNDKELLGLMDQRMIHTMLEIIVCWGIYPCLLPGVGMPLNRRVRSNIVQKELFTPQPNAMDKPVDRSKSTNTLWSIIKPLAGITIAYSPKVTRFTTLGSILASRHVPDLYASLLQLAYRPLPKPVENPRHGNDNEITPAQEVLPKPKKLTPGNLVPKATNSIPESSPATSTFSPTSQQTSRVSMDEPERANQLVIKEESAKMFHDLFWNTEASRSLESLTILLSSSSPTHPTPAWIKSVSGRFLSQILLRPGGVRVVLEYMQGGVDTVKLDQLEKIARLVTSVPDQMSSVQEYYHTICSELLEILEMSLGLVDPEKSVAQGMIAPPSPQLVQIATFVVGKLLTKNPAICQVEIVARELEPLWKWGTRASRKVPTTTAKDALGQNNVKRGVTLVEEIDEEFKDEDEISSLDHIVASEYEIAKAVLFLHSFLVGNEPSPLLYQALLSQAAQGLYQLYEFLVQKRSVLREKVKEILVVYFRILDPNDTVEILKSIVMRRRLPVPPSKPWLDTVALDGRKIGKLVEMGSVGESYFALGPSGSAVLRRRSFQDQSAATQLELDVDIFLDFLSDLETSGHEGEILGDLYMYLLDEYQASKGRGANTVSPRRMLTMLQLILSMTEKLGPSIMSKVTQIIALANNILENHFSQSASDLGEDGEDKDEEADVEILGLVLTLLSAILTDNEHLSAQDQHLLSLTLENLRKLSDHPLIEIRRVAHDLQTLIPTRLSNTNKSEEAPKKTEMEVEMEKYASALAALQDGLLPVRAHGLHILRDMILSKSIVLTRSTGGGGGAERELDHALDIFVQHVQEPDSFIYLNAVKGLAALTDAHGSEILQKLMRIYSNEDGRQKLDTRLRIGEALVQTIQRCGEALGRYLDALLPGLYKVMNTSVDPVVVQAREEERKALLEKAKAKKASEALLTSEEKQRKWKAELESQKASTNHGGYGQANGDNNNEDEEDAIVDEVSLLRSSALTILATAAETCPTALLPEMRYLVDWVLSILDLDRQIEVRRAATLVVVLLFRALGNNSLYRIEGDQLKRAYRTLRYIEQVDEDPLCRAQARTGIVDLDGVVRTAIGSEGRMNSGDIQSNRSGVLEGAKKSEIRYK